MAATGGPHPVSLMGTKSKSEAQTQTSSLKDVVQETLSTMVTNYLRTNRFPLIECPHTTSLQLENIIKAIAGSHQVMCTQTDQSCSQQGGQSHQHELDQASMMIQVLSDAVSRAVQEESMSTSNVDQNAKASVKNETHSAPARKKFTITRQPKGTLYPCAQCGETFDMQKDLIKHYSSVHSLERPFKCDQCEIWFKTHSECQRHKKRIHMNQYRYYCSICNRGCDSQNKLIEHENRHSKGEDRLFKCKYCKKGFSKNRELIMHIRVHEEDSKVQCELCTARFCYYNNSYKLHMENVHKAYVRYEVNKCLLCDKDFGNAKQRPLLMGHMDEHHSNVGVACKVCDRKFASASKLEVHESREHDIYNNPIIVEEMKKHRCKICGSKFISAPRLKSHEKSEHLSVSMENYTPEVVPVIVGKNKRLLLMCKMCGGMFTEQTALDQHFPIHNKQESALPADDLADILDTQQAAACPPSTVTKITKISNKKKKKAKKSTATTDTGETDAECSDHMEIASSDESDV